MKKFKDFLKEQPTNHVGNGGFTNAANPDGPVAGFDKKLFPGDEDLLSQDFQTPGESGLAEYEFAPIYPVMHLSLADIDAMVKASNEFTQIMNRHTEDVVKQNYKQFINKK